MEVGVEWESQTVYIKIKIKNETDNSLKQLTDKIIENMFIPE